MNYKYISIPSDNSFNRSTPIYGVKVDLNNTQGTFSIDYFAYNFDLSAPASSSNFYQKDDELGNFVIKVWSHYVKNNNNSAEVKDKNDVCTFFQGDTPVSSVFNSVSTEVYEISFCQPLYLRNIGYFNSTIDEARARGRIELLVEDPVSIIATPSKTTLGSEGETISINVTCENAWTVTGNTFLTLSATGDTGSTTITATAPSYSGATDRTDTLTFTDTVTGDEAELVIKQKKYASGQPVYLGGDEITEIYLGGDTISEAYLGEDLVFSTGPFVGLKVFPKSIAFNDFSTTSQIRVKSSESWSLTAPAWITASTITGDTGEIIVSLTATTQQANTADTISITSASFSASVVANYNLYEPVSYVYATNHNSYVQANHIDTGIEHTASTMSVEIEYYGLGTGTTFSDRIVGYSPGDNGCIGDSNDFRLFGYRYGTFDYMTYRNTFGGYYNRDYHHCTIGDCFCYDNGSSTYVCQGSSLGQVPSPSCHILVDVSYTKVKSLKIMDGNTVLFDGVAAKIGTDIGIYDRVSGQLKRNDNVPMTYDA